jgi:hypothetical protein
LPLQADDLGIPFGVADRAEKLIFRLYQREYLTDLFRDGVTVVAKAGVPTSVTLDRPSAISDGNENGAPRGAVIF